MSKEETVAPFKLALRVEGTWWVAYIKMVHSADAGVELGRIRMVAAHVPAIKDGFMALMRLAVEDAMKEVVVPVDHWGGAQPAPESERSGRA